MIEVDVTGAVRRARINVGSKSEREAIVIDINRGIGMHTVELRMVNGTSFGDASFDHLVGQRVKIEGLQSGGTLFVRTLDDVKILGPAGRPSGPNPAP